MMEESTTSNPIEWKTLPIKKKNKKAEAVAAEAVATEDVVVAKASEKFEAVAVVAVAAAAISEVKANEDDDHLDYAFGSKKLLAAAPQKSGGKFDRVVGFAKGGGFHKSGGAGSGGGFASGGAGGGKIVPLTTEKRFPERPEKLHEAKGGSSAASAGPADVKKPHDNYIPKAIREQLDAELNPHLSSKSTWDKIKAAHSIKYEVMRKNRSTSSIWERKINMYIIHKGCAQNSEEILASVIDKAEDKLVYVNALCNENYNVLCNAAYFGSDKCINYLINRGADIHVKNIWGESILEALDIGLAKEIGKYPHVKEILTDKFENCKRLLAMAEARLAGGASAAEEEKEVAPPASAACKYKTEYSAETLLKDITEYIEKPAEFREFVPYLLEKGFKDLLIEVLSDETMEDILMDNPHAGKLMSELKIL